VRSGEERKERVAEIEKTMGRGIGANPGVAREKIMGHPVVHFEIGCRDSAKTQEFYAKLFDWKIQQAGPAAMIDTGGGITGHITALGHEPFHYTTFYVEVEDVKAYLEKAVSLGGKMLVPAMDIPTGTFAWMQDPEGNTIGLWKPAKK
jgi:predicted enzyme related to lactoylglutathione lyase